MVEVEGVNRERDARCCCGEGCVTIKMTKPRATFLACAMDRGEGCTSEFDYASALMVRKQAGAHASKVMVHGHLSDRA
jgi:hypothetical protein